MLTYQVRLRKRAFFHKCCSDTRNAAHAQNSTTSFFNSTCLLWLQSISSQKKSFCYQNGEQNCGVALLAHHHSRGSWSAWKHWRSVIPTLHGCTNIRTNNRRNGLFKPCRRLNKHITDWADLLLWVQNWEILEFLSGFRSYRFKTISRLDQVLQIPT